MAQNNKEPREQEGDKSQHKSESEQGSGNIEKGSMGDVDRDGDQL